MQGGKQRRQRPSVGGLAKWQATSCGDATTRFALFWRKRVAGVDTYDLAAACLRCFSGGYAVGPSKTGGRPCLAQLANPTPRSWLVPCRSRPRQCRTRF